MYSIPNMKCFFENVCKRNPPQSSCIDGILDIKFKLPVIPLFMDIVHPRAGYFACAPRIAITGLYVPRSLMWCCKMRTQKLFFPVPLCLQPKFHELFAAAWRMGKLPAFHAQSLYIFYFCCLSAVVRPQELQREAENLVGVENENEEVKFTSPCTELWAQNGCLC